MATIKAMDAKAGDRLLIDGDVSTVISNTYFKPGKGQATSTLVLLPEGTGVEVTKTVPADTLLELLP